MVSKKTAANEHAEEPAFSNSDFDVIEAHEKCEDRRRLAALDGSRLLSLDEHLVVLRKAGLHV